MLIYFNGDSNTAGTELKSPSTQGFAAHISSLLHAQHINDATPGASNSKILRTAEEYLRSCYKSKTYPDLIIIGWSESSREDWFINGSYQSLNTFDLAIPENIDAERYNYWKTMQGHDGGYRSQMPKFWNNTIHNFHLELNFLNIPHLFFNAIESFNSHESDWAKIYRLDWSRQYFHPYNPDFAMIKWAEQLGYEQITPGWFHYDEPAQQAWAKLLYNYIKENNLI